jgi:hypothetical protein
MLLQVAFEQQGLKSGVYDLILVTDISGCIINLGLTELEMY